MKRMPKLYVLVLYSLIWREAKGDNSGSIVDQVRSRINAWHRQRPDLYNKADADFVNQNDKLIRMAYDVKKDFNGTAHRTHEILLWRKSENINTLASSEFPAEIFYPGSETIIGRDRDGDVVIWAQAKSKWNY